MDNDASPDDVLKNEGSMVQTLDKNVHVVNTDIWMFMDCIWQQTYQCAQYGLKKLIGSKPDSRNTQARMFLCRTIKEALNFAGMLLEACKQHVLLLEIIEK